MRCVKQQCQCLFGGSVLTACLSLHRFAALAKRSTSDGGFSSPLCGCVVVVVTVASPFLSAED